MSASHRNAVILAVWVILLGGGFWQLFNYANTPGELAKSHVHWPAETVLSRDETVPTLVIFAHPQCSCSQATVGELERLMPHIHGKVKSLVVFFKPKTKSENWAKAALWKKARAIPGVQTILDEDGIEAEKFGAKISGQTFLYDAKGSLVFNGGITPERGHMGDSDGRSAILHFVAAGTATLSKTPVFGCSIRSPERALAGGSK